MPYQRVVRALYAYEAADTDELSFAEDELLVILPGGDDDWLVARALQNGDASGVIPANYVEALEGICRIRALYEYAAQEDNEVSFGEDETLTLLARLDEDWWLVRTGREEYGLVPANHFEELDGGDDGGGSGAAEEENVFAQPEPEMMSEARPEVRSGLLKDVFPNAKPKNKWAAEWRNKGKDKIKGKLLLLDSSQLVFVHGKEKIIGFVHELSECNSYDLKAGELVLSGKRRVAVALSKGDGKELQAKIQESGPILRGPIIVRDTGGAEEEDGAGRNVAEPVEEETAQAPRLAKYTLAAIYDYQGQADDEISMAEGDIIEILDDTDADWWLVRNSNGGSDGLVPKSFLIEQCDEQDNVSVGEPEEPHQEYYDAESGQEQQMEQHVEQYTEQHIEQHVEPHVKQYLEPHMEPHMEQYMEPDAEQHIEQNMEPDAEQYMEQSMDPDQEQFDQGEDEPVVESRMEADAEDYAEETRMAPPAPPAQSTPSVAPAPPPAPFLGELLQKSKQSVEILKQKVAQQKDTDNVAAEAARAPPKTASIPPPPPPPLPGRSSIPAAPPAPPPLPSRHEEGSIRPPPNLPERSKDPADRETMTTAAPTPGLDAIQAATRNLKHAERSLENAPAPVPKSNPWATVSLKKNDQKSSAGSDNLNMNSLNKALPSRPDKPASDRKPSPAETRLWKDKSGKFQTEAAFVSFDKGAVVLHKLNGSKVSVPVAMLSERDVEYVHRRCGLAVPEALRSAQGAKGDAAPKAAAASGGGFAVKGFDWLQFLVDCGIEAGSAAELAEQLVRASLDEIWLDSVTRDKLRAALKIGDGDALLVMQGVTKRKLKRLEKAGQERLLESLKKPVEPARVEEAKIAAAAIPAPFAQPVLQPVQMQRKIKDIPVLQPQNTIRSVQMPTQPIFKEFMTSGTVPLPNGQIAQQSTTTQYMMRRSASGEPIGTANLASVAPVGATGMANVGPYGVPATQGGSWGQTNTRTSTDMMAMSGLPGMNQSMSHMSGMNQSMSHMSGMNQSMSHMPAMNPNMSHMPAMNPNMSHVSGGNLNAMTPLQPLRPTQPMSNSSNQFGGMMPMAPGLQSYQNAQGINVSQQTQQYAYPAAGSLTQQPQQSQQQQLQQQQPGMLPNPPLQPDGDKYAIFRSVDPTSSSLLNSRPPAQPQNPNPGFGPF